MVDLYICVNGKGGGGEDPPPALPTSTVSLSALNLLYLLLHSTPSSSTSLITNIPLTFSLLMLFIVTCQGRININRHICAEV